MLGPAGTGRQLWGIEQGGAGCSPILNSIYCDGVVEINSIVGKKCTVSPPAPKLMWAIYVNIHLKTYKNSCLLINTSYI